MKNIVEIGLVSLLAGILSCSIGKILIIGGIAACVIGIVIREKNI